MLPMYAAVFVNVQYLDTVRIITCGLFFIKPDMELLKIVNPCFAVSSYCY
jgi:hypothetical protein